MKMLAMSASAGVVAFCVAWFVLPCQPERSMPVAFGTKLVEFSPAGRYVVTIRCEERRLTLWNANTGQATYETEVPYIARSIYSAKDFYGFSSNDQCLAVTAGRPHDPDLVIVDLASNNAMTRITALPPEPDYLCPCPAFSADDRYLNYVIKDPRCRMCAVLYDLAGRSEQFRIEGLSSSLIPPTRQGKWLLQRPSGIECWDVTQRRKVATILHENKLLQTFFTPDEQAVTGSYVAAYPSLQQRVVFFRYEFAKQEFETEREYALPPMTPIFWNLDSWEPVRFVLVSKQDENDSPVQDVLEVSTGQLVARNHEPVEMQNDEWGSWRTKLSGTGRAYLLGRTGGMSIDSKGQILVSKQKFRDDRLWRHFGKVLRWLGAKQPAPREYLQFQSTQTGKLLERVSHRDPWFPGWGPEVLAMHPSEPLLAVIDMEGNEARLQLWHVPPRKPWIWIIGCALAVGGFPALVVFGYSKLRKKSTNIASD
jgi:WD40 repeat protein